MKLSSIKLKNFKVFEDETIFFDKNLTVLVGKNGVGKSSVLEAISIVFTWLIAGIKNKKEQGEFISEKQVRNNCDKSEITSLFENNTSIRINYSTSNTYSIWDTVSLFNKYKDSIPIFVNYGVERAFSVKETDKKPKLDFDIFSAYDDAVDSLANFTHFFDWYRYKEDIENESLRDGLGLDRELEIVREAISTFMPGFNNLRIRRNPERMTIDKEGQTFSINQLSDGEKTYIALVGDLCKRLILANPTLENPLLGEGIVLIDELDLHLHPQWQKEIATRLCETFPNIQFIVTTHSPLVINSVKTKHIRIIDIENGKANVFESEYSYGLPVSIVLEDVMGISNELPKEIKEKLDSAYDSLDEGDLDKAKSILEELQSLAPKLPDLVRIRKFIEIKSRK